MGSAHLDAAGLLTYLSLALGNQLQRKRNGVLAARSAVVGVRHGIPRQSRGYRAEGHTGTYAFPIWPTPAGLR
ncbi:hypothetical protein [Mycolicibacterium celeriflavum]|uniref:hypothetical protein n=1 Tax=Mycolicibacterium celeriflavum TaxID=1249101 RepID=UPI001054D218|nr:hypothetical protein [Mycolicibacterium celeriflavum]MCV7240270.1 hypothetical protein [Mycolicibacterium celeriflavum]